MSLIEDAIEAKKSNYTEYTVKSGDTWAKIAREQMGHPIRMINLVMYNGKTLKSALNPGDVLRIPTMNAIKPSTIVNTNTTNIINTDRPYTTYTVEPGDTWSTIAEAKMGNRLKMIILARFNNMSLNTPLNPGDEIKIPE